jgi:hypothetical protein
MSEKAILYLPDYYNKETQECFTGIVFRTFKPIQILPECEILVEAEVDIEGTEALIYALWAIAKDPHFTSVQGDLLAEIRKHEELLKAVRDD